MSQAKVTLSHLLVVSCTLPVNQDVSGEAIAVPSPISPQPPAYGPILATPPCSWLLRHPVAPPLGFPKWLHGGMSQ
eukprot:6649141-Pyramimonas_sp.AAC.1